jgi:hypothetical protein
MNELPEELNSSEIEASGVIYNGEWIPVPHHRLTSEIQIQLLDWHPIFSGRCPNCEIPIATPENSKSDWHCLHCNWSLSQSAEHIDLRLS